MTSEHKAKFFNFQKNIFPIISNVSAEEYSFISAVVEMMEEEDIESNDHLSAYSYPVSIEDGRVNYSRFIFGTKTKPEKFGQMAKAMLFNQNIEEDPPEEYKWYGIGWDIQNKQIKVYHLSEDNSKIICNEYVRTLGTKLRTKKYQVGKEKTVMEKEGKLIEQVNGEKIHNQVVERMTDLGFELDTYSQYDKKLTLYFD